MNRGVNRERQDDIFVWDAHLVVIVGGRRLQDLLDEESSDYIALLLKGIGSAQSELRKHCDMCDQLVRVDIC